MNNDERKRLLPAHEIIPHAVTLWNRCKGGQDVVSRQLKNVQINFRQMKPRTYILIRQVMTQLLNAHLVYRIMDYVGKQLGDNYKDVTYDRLKDILNETSTFQYTLSLMFKLCNIENFRFIDLVVKKEENENNEDENNDENVRLPKRNRLRFFNSKPGTNIRFKGTNATDHMQISYNRTNCLLCGSETTVRCSTCEINLCKNKFGKKLMTCFEKFHCQTILKFSPRKNKKTKKKTKKNNVTDEDSSDENDEDNENNIGVAIEENNDEDDNADKKNNEDTTNDNDNNDEDMNDAKPQAQEIARLPRRALTRAFVNNSRLESTITPTTRRRLYTTTDVQYDSVARLPVQNNSSQATTVKRSNKRKVCTNNPNEDSDSD